MRRVDATGTITTFAGTGEPGYGGDGGPASQGQLYSPEGVAVDGIGNVYITNYHGHRVHKVDVTGTITTFAGTGERGYGGDGGPASEAQLERPSGVAVDGIGNVYIADTGNRRVRKVEADGTITTFAGTGERGYGGDGGPASEAQLDSPIGVAVDALGNAYITDPYSQRVRRVDADGTITTFAGTGERGYGGDGGPASQAQLVFPAGVGVDAIGNVYIADEGDARVRRVDATATITTFAGTGERGYGGDGGPASQAQFISPYGVAVDAVGNVYIADPSSQRVRRVEADGTITTFAGTGESGYGGDGGPASQAHLREPEGVVADAAGNVYIADSSNHRVRRVDPNGIITTFAGSDILPLGTRQPVEDLPDAQPLQDFYISVSAIAASPTLGICIRDHECEDGDRVSVLFDNVTIFDDVELKRNWNCKAVTLGRDPSGGVISSVPIEMIAENGTGFKGICNHGDANTGELRIIGQTEQTQSWKHRGGAGSSVRVMITVAP